MDLVGELRLVWVLGVALRGVCVSGGCLGICGVAFSRCVAVAVRVGLCVCDDCWVEFHVGWCNTDSVTFWCL